MSRIGYGYGSECHLLRWMGRHRKQLNAEVTRALRLDVIGLDWVDFSFNPSRTWADEEVKGVDFLRGEKDWDGYDAAWRAYWPDPDSGHPLRQRIHSWDAIGRISLRGGASEWLLVEAKAHEKEFLGYPTTACQAGGDSLTTIVRALTETADHMGVPHDAVESTWLGVGCYQVANRFATLNFLLNRARPPQPARLLFLYFTHDSHANWRCPSSASEWRKLIAGMYARMSIPRNHGLADRTHYLFLDVAPGARMSRSR